MAHRKIWKSILAKLLLCPAFQPQRAYSQSRMEMYRVEHEEIRLQFRMKMISEGWHVAFCEMPCENDFMKGRIDDIIERPNCILAVEYSSSSSPRGEKLLDTAISAGFLKYEFELDTEAILVSNGEVTSLPHDFIERTWKMVESFPKQINLDDEVLLQYANIASGLCNFCDNNHCKGSAPMGL